MDIYNKEISTKLEQKFKEEIKWIKGSSINNCIICQESSSKVISYNYFDAIQKDKQIKLKFISVYISPESK